MITSKSSKPTIKEPLIEIFSELGRPCAIPLILALGERSCTTNVRELRQKIDSSNGRIISESALLKCLTGLSVLGLVQRTDRAESHHEAGYRLTHVGQEIYRHILQMRHWAEIGSGSSNISVSNVSAC